MRARERARVRARVCVEGGLVRGALLYTTSRMGLWTIYPYPLTHSAVPEGQRRLTASACFRTVGTFLEELQNRGALGA